MSAEGSTQVEDETEVLFEQVEIESSVEPPEEEWSSLLCWLQGSELNEKHRLHAQGLYQPTESAEICAKYIPLSDSSVYRHPYYPYPSVPDPGVEEALLQPPPVIEYDDNGQNLYIVLCKEMNEPYSRIFHKQLLQEHMNMSYYGISSMGWRPMAMALKNNRIVKSIDFTSNFISHDGCFHFGDLLLHNFTITELNFSGCRMGSEGIRRLVKNFTKSNTLRKINLSKNQLGDEGLAHLATAIFLGANVSNINISFNNLTSTSATLLATAIEFANKITHLDLSCNCFMAPKALEILLSRFIGSENFLEINLSWNSLSNRYAKGLCNLLLCPNLQVINLSNNNLTGEVIALITQKLLEAQNLRVLDLSYNPLTITDVTLLLTYMKRRRVKLKQLLMDNVYVDEEFVRFKNRVLKLKFRKDCVITHGYVRPNIYREPMDMRELVLRRMQILCRKPKKKRVDVGLMILQLNKIRNGEPILNSELPRFFNVYGAFQLNKDVIEELALAFPGPRYGKTRTASVTAMANFVSRYWPETKLPPTPPPTTPPPPPPPPPPPALGRGKGVKAKGKPAAKPVTDKKGKKK